MIYLSTTDLRTKSSLLINMLATGKSVGLLHRSRVVAHIDPVVADDEIEDKVLTKDKIKDLIKISESLNLPKISYTEREKRYRKYIMGKYG
jgi:hypothetical protein